MIAARMKNASCNDAVAFDPVKELVRKAAHEYATKTTIVNGIALRIANQSLERSFDFGDEPGAQSNAMTFVPVSGLAQIGLGPPPNGELPGHRAISRSSGL